MKLKTLALLTTSILGRAAFADVAYDNFGAGDTFSTLQGWTIAGSSITSGITSACQFTSATTGMVTHLIVAPELASGPNSLTVRLYEDKPIGISLPDQVVLEIVEADPVVRGQTAASSYKPAVLENGIRILVPPFIAAGERVLVDTNELTYLRRAD